VVLMGWSYDDQTEFFTLEDLIPKFSIGKLNPKNAAIDFKKLDHFNGLHIRHLEIKDLAQRIRPFIEEAGFSAETEVLEKIAVLLQPRLTTLDEVPDWVRFMFVDQVSPRIEDLVVKGLESAGALEVAEKLYQILDRATEYNYEQLEQPIRDLADTLSLKLGQVFGVLRIALTGQAVSPPLIESMDILGKEKTLERLKNAISLLSGSH